MGKANLWGCKGKKPSRINYIHVEQQTTENTFIHQKKTPISRNKFTLEVKLLYKPLKTGSSNTRCTNLTDTSPKLLTKQSTLGSFLMKSEVQQSWHSNVVTSGSIFPACYWHNRRIFKLRRHPVVAMGVLRLSQPEAPLLQEFNKHHHRHFK